MRETHGQGPFSYDRLGEICRRGSVGYHSKGETRGQDPIGYVN